MPPTDNTDSQSLALVIVNGRVWTGDPRRPWADAVLVRGERIEGVGSSAEIRKRADGGARIVDARGMMVLPELPHGVLAPGQPASLIVTSRPQAMASVGSPEDAEIVLRLEHGRVVIDRDALGAQND
jgi:predicted amidohydrolase YtcJ